MAGDFGQKAQARILALAPQVNNLAQECRAHDFSFWFGRSALASQARIWFAWRCFRHHRNQSNTFGLKKLFPLIASSETPVSHFTPRARRNAERQTEHSRSHQQQKRPWITRVQRTHRSRNHPGFSNRKRLLLDRFHVTL